MAFFGKDETATVELKKELLPRHVAIIMDGNGRWAQKRGMPRSFGHNAGVEALREINRQSDHLGISSSIYSLFTGRTEQMNDRFPDDLAQYVENDKNDRDRRVGFV